MSMSLVWSRGVASATSATFVNVCKGTLDSTGLPLTFFRLLEREALSDEARRALLGLGEGEQRSIVIEVMMMPRLIGCFGCVLLWWSGPRARSAARSSPDGGQAHGLRSPREFPDAGGSGGWALPGVGPWGGGGRATKEAKRKDTTTAAAAHAQSTLTLGESASHGRERRQRGPMSEETLRIGEHIFVAILRSPDVVLGSPLHAQVELRSEHVDADGIVVDDPAAWRAAAAAIRIQVGLHRARDGSSLESGPVFPVLATQPDALPTVAGALTVTYDLTLSCDDLTLSSQRSTEVELELRAELLAPPVASTRFGARRAELSKLDSDACFGVFMHNQAAEVPAMWSLRRPVLLVRPLRLTRLTERVGTLSADGAVRSILNVGLSNHSNRAVQVYQVRVCAAADGASRFASSPAPQHPHHHQRTERPASSALVQRPAATTAGLETTTTPGMLRQASAPPSTSTSAGSGNGGVGATPATAALASNGSSSNVGDRGGGGRGAAAVRTPAAGGSSTGGRPGRAESKATAAAGSAATSSASHAPPWLLLDGALPITLAPEASYAFGCCAATGDELLISVEWYPCDEGSLDPPEPPLPRSLHRANFPMRTLASRHEEDSPCLVASIVPVEPIVHLGVPFAATLRITNTLDTDLGQLELRVPPPVARTDDGLAGGDARTPAVLCLMDGGLLSRLRAGESASTRLECVAVCPGLVCETLRVCAYDAVAGVPVAEIEADIEVRVEGGMQEGGA
jgi:hypothetical protein